MNFPITRIYKDQKAHKDGKTMTSTLQTPAAPPAPPATPVRASQAPLFGPRDKYFHLTKYYLAYGSNLHLQQMSNRCPDAKAIAPIHLPNFRLVFRSVADIEPHKGSVVHGAVYEISEADERALDRYEGYPTMYRKEFISAKLRGEAITIMYYTMNNDRISPPPSGYYATIDTGFENWKLDKKHLIAALDHSHKMFDAKKATRLLAKNGLVLNIDHDDDDDDDTNSFGEPKWYAPKDDDPDGGDMGECDHEQTIVDEYDDQWCLVCGYMLVLIDEGDTSFWAWVEPDAGD